MDIGGYFYGWAFNGLIPFGNQELVGLDAEESTQALWESVYMKAFGR